MIYEIGFKVLPNPDIGIPSRYQSTELCDEEIILKDIDEYVKRTTSVDRLTKALLELG